MKPRRLLTIGHSYVVSLNRRLAHELQRQGEGRWEVTVVSPRHLYGDLRREQCHIDPGEPCRVEMVNLYGSSSAHRMVYGRSLKSLLAHGWDMVHVWEEPYILSSYLLSRWIPRDVPFVFWTMQNIVKRYPYPVRFLEKQVIRRCAGWIAVGKTTADVQLQRAIGYESRPHRILPLGVDINVFRPDPAQRQAVLQQLKWELDGPPVVGFVGRLVPEKGLELLLNALDAQHTPWRALVIGTGPMESRLREWSLRHSGRVRVLTHVTHDMVPSYLNAMDMLAAPSQTTASWREQFGRMLLEAMACRVPVLGSDSGEIPQVIGDTGRVLPENDSTAWVSALDELLGSPALRADLGQRGAQRVHEHFAWPIVARRHLDFFDELLDSRKAQSRQ